MIKIINAVEKNIQKILEAEQYVWAHPETGYKEYKTSAYLESEFEKLGYDLVLAENIPGFYTVIDTGRPGPELLILGELDSVICPTHKDSNTETGAVHSCGHNVQCAALLGVACALKEPGILEGLSGKIKLCAVPAEELLEIEFRRDLQQKGIIKYFGGKTEFLHRGYFDSVDLAFMVHASNIARVRIGSVGLIAKNIVYKGLAAHAGGTPWAGKNALYAATCGINAVNAIRETFKEEDIIRFHPIITSGGTMVNAIPEEARIETYVRGKTFDSILTENKKINRALCGAALSLDCNIEIVDIPGYAPLVNAPDMIDVCIEAFNMSIPNKEIVYEKVISSGSTDMGDLSAIMPVVHPYIGGIMGKGHGNDYMIADKEHACIDNVKWQMTMIKLLLGDGAKRAKEIVANFVPTFKSKKEFLAFQDSINDQGDRIVYENGIAKIRI